MWFRTLATKYFRSVQYFNFVTNQSTSAQLAIRFADRFQRLLFEPFVVNYRVIRFSGDLSVKLDDRRK